MTCRNVELRAGGLGHALQPPRRLSEAAARAAPEGGGAMPAARSADDLLDERELPVPRELVFEVWTVAERACRRGLAANCRASRRIPPTREHPVATLIYAMNTSLDGYISDREG